MVDLHFTPNVQGVPPPDRITIRGQPSLLDNLHLILGGKPMRKGEPHVPSGNHQRRWCHFHRKVCCMIHGPKHKRGKIFKGPKSR